MLDSLLVSPWPWFAAAVLCIAAGFVAASGWPKGRRS